MNRFTRRVFSNAQARMSSRKIAFERAENGSLIVTIWDQNEIGKTVILDARQGLSLVQFLRETER